MPRTDTAPLTAGERAAALAAARRVADGFIARRGDGDGNYPFDLALEALLVLHEVTGEARYRDAVLAVARRRGWSATNQPRPGKPPFTLLIYELYRLAPDPAFVEPFVQATRTYVHSIRRDAHRRVLHPNRWRDTHSVLIDSLQEYARRMAAAGALANDDELLGECVEQFRLHDDAVRDPATGLWCQGVGWDADDEPSPHAWSRGQGWVLRGMIECLRSMPAEHPAAAALRGLAGQLAEAVVRVQHEQGMWHALPNLPHDRSAAESSGTGMLAYALARGVHEHHLDARFAGGATLAVRALTRCVTSDGVVLHACVGPGPLRREHVARYLDVPGFEPDDEHGHGAVILGLSGAAWL